MDSRSRNGEFSRRSKDIAVDFWATVSELRNARCEDRISADEDHPEVEYQEESPKAESSKRRPIPSWPLYEYFRGRVILRGDVVEDDSGSYAVFAEQGSSASLTTTAPKEC